MSWIQTHSGRRFDLLNPRPEMIDLDDIAHALGNLCRFTGHVERFDSVAQHSVVVSELVPPEDALAGLLHDATEAYVGDVSRPLKQLLPEYRLIEHGIWLAIAERFGVPATLPTSVKEADSISLLWERRDLLGEPVESWGQWVEETVVARVPEERYRPMDPEEATGTFLGRFFELTGKAG